MNKKIQALCILGMVTVGFTACGSDPEDNNNTNKPDMTTGTPDMPTGTPDMPTGTPDMPTDTPDMPSTMPDMETMPDMTTPPAAMDCNSDPKPARCTADPSTFTDWGPASVVSKLMIAGETECCVDFDGDGEVNNGLGALASIASTQGTDLNVTLQGAIDDGSVALVLEHEGLNTAGGDFAINFLLGDQDGDFTAPDAAGGNKYTINPASFDQGVWPQARIGQATLSGTAVTSMPGVVGITIELFGIGLNLRVSEATVKAAVAAGSDAATGVKLTDGEIGGIIRVADLANELNKFAANNCGCIQKDGASLTEPFLVPDADKPGPANFACTAGLTYDMCDEADQVQNVCKQAGQVCSYLSFLPLLADVDSTKIYQNCVDEDTCDSISAGLKFEAAGAVITGVSAE